MILDLNKPFLTLFLVCLFVNLNKCQINKCKFENSLDDVNVAIGFDPRSKGVRATSVGTLNIAVIFTDFSDAPAKDLTPQQMISKLSPITEDFFSRNSYGKLKLNLVPFYKWLRMSKPSADYTDSGVITFYKHRAYLQEAADLATSSGFDFSKLDLIVVLSNPGATAYSYSPAFCSVPGWGVQASGKEFFNGVTTGADYTYWTNTGRNGQGYLLVHELGHTLGLPDLYSFIGGETHQFVGDWSVMSNINSNGKSFFGWERWLLGWLDDAQVSCISNKTTTTTTVNLSAIETVDKLNPMKIAVVQTGVKQGIVIEVRRNIDDDVLSKEGLLVYLVDANVRTGSGPVRVLPSNLTDTNKLNNVLTLGKSISYGTATVTLKSISKSNVYQVQIVSTYNPSG